MTVLSNELIRKADCYIDKNHKAFSALGQRFFDTFGYEKKNNRISTQIRNLQQMACSAARFADIEDFVKNQMGKEKGDASRWRALGTEVLNELRKLRDQSQKLDGDGGNQMALRLRLARGWVRAVVGEYLYSVARDQMEAAS